jgi:hypothetical protein
MPKYILFSLNVILVIALGIRAITKNFFSNTFEIEKLVTILLISGLVLALVWSRCYVKKNNITDSIERAQTVLTMVVATMGFFVAMGVNLNYLVSLQNAEEKIVQVTNIQPFMKIRGGIVKGEKITPSGYHVFIQKDGKNERLRYETMDDYQTFIGKELNFSFLKGLLGFEVCLPKPLKINNFY